MTEGEDGNIGHNGAAGAQLRSFVERATRLEEAKREIGEDLKELFREAKGNGYDGPALKALVKEQMEDESKRQKRLEREAMVELYRSSLGALGDTPLGAAAAEQAADAPKAKRKRRTVNERVADNKAAADRGEAERLAALKGTTGEAPADQPTTTAADPAAVGSSFAADAAAEADRAWPDDQQVANAEREAETVAA